MEKRSWCGHLKPKYERQGYIVECDEYDYMTTNKKDMHISHLMIEGKANGWINVCPRTYVNIEYDYNTKKTKLTGELLVLKSKSDIAKEIVKKIGCEITDEHSHAVLYRRNEFDDRKDYETDTDFHVHIDCGEYTNKKLDIFVEAITKAWGNP